jgi:hypothetical protein
MKFKYYSRLNILFILLLTAGLNAQKSKVSFSSIFNENQLHKIEISIEKDDWRFALDATGTYEQAQIKIDNHKPIHVQIARKGNTANSNTRARDKFPFKIDGPNGFNFKLNNNYRDYTMGARESMAYRLHREFTGIGSKTAPAEVFVNGEFYGLYLVVEDLNSSFYEENIGEILNRVKGSPTLAGLYQNFHCNLFWLGENIEFYEDRYELKKGDIKDLITLIDIINNKPDIAYQYIDIDQVCRFLAVENYLINTDGLIGNVFSHNYELVQRESDGKWQIIPWDLNMCLGGWSSPSLVQSETLIDEIVKFPLNEGTENNALVQLILNKYFFLYHHYYIQLLEKYPASKLIDWAHSFRNVLEQSSHTDDKLYEYELFEKSYTEDVKTIDGFVTGLIPTITKRYDFIQSLALAKKFSNKISHVEQVNDTLLIFPSIDLGTSSLIVEYQTSSDDLKKLRAYPRKKGKEGYYCILPSDAMFYYAYTLYKGVKYDYPVQGIMEPKRKL